MKKFTKFEIATIKRTAQNVSPMVSKKRKIAAQIIALKEEYDNLAKMQEQYEASIRTMTGGFSTEDLVNKVVETTNSLDKNGNPVKITKFVLKYPETVVPPTEETPAQEVEDTTEEEPNTEVSETLYETVE